jgi:putative methanogenesis marker protein 12
MFIGIDHGTTSMRFSCPAGEFKISREEARHFVIGDLGRICPPEDIEGIGLSYSMGDNFSAITSIDLLENRGLVSREGAGKHVGGGTRVFDQVRESGIPAIVIPGLHRGSPTDPRFKAYSHQASPEKVGIAYEVCHDLGGDVVVSDASSNTVTLLVMNWKIAGAIDACIFAPGTVHGAIDVDAIRKIDAGEMTANEAFLHAGVNYSLPEKDRIPALAMFAAMECAAMRVLCPRAKVALAGSLAPVIGDRVREHLCTEVAVYDEWCASRGIARITRDVFSGKDEILGLGVKM